MRREINTLLAIVLGLCAPVLQVSCIAEVGSEDDAELMDDPDAVDEELMVDGEREIQANRLQNPVPGYRVTTPFGVKGSWHAGYHTGVDYAAPLGTLVRATKAGKVKTVSRSAYGGDYGLHVVIQTNGVRHIYAHLRKALVKRGHRVRKGTRIGRVGNSGRSYGPHLHYEERVWPYGYWDHRRPRLNASK
jgi:murein DD-endopeptidase MepM/ murein hydrolase activator NlpD